MKYALLLLAFTLAAAQDPKSEANPERRAKLALDQADAALNKARQAFAKGDMQDMSADLDEMKNSIELAQSSLTETGKDARRKPKSFKYGETKTRDMLKRLDSLEKAANFDDRKLIAPARAKVQEVHDAWLLGIMGTK